MIIDLHILQGLLESEDHLRTMDLVKLMIRDEDAVVLAFSYSIVFVFVEITYATYTVLTGRVLTGRGYTLVGK